LILPPAAESSSALRCIVTNMKRLVLALVLLFPVALVGQSFSISFPNKVSAQPLDGRLLLVLSTDPSDEPRNQIDDTPRSQIVFGLTVDGWQPGQPADGGLERLGLSRFAASRTFRPASTPCRPC
jgi:hypothetical protein